MMGFLLMIVLAIAIVAAFAWVFTNVVFGGLDDEE